MNSTKKNDLMVEVDQISLYDVKYRESNLAYLSSQIDQIDVRNTNHFLIQDNKDDQKKFWMGMMDMFNFKANRNLNQTQGQTLDIKIKNLFSDFDNEIEDRNGSIINILIQKIKVIDPDSDFYIIWQIFNVLLILYLITEISLITFFYIDFRRDDSNLIFLKTVISVSLFVFLIDILISLNLGFYIQGKLEVNRLNIAKNYIIYEFLLDVIPMLSLILQYEDHKKNTLFYIISPFFYMKIRQIFKLHKKIVKLLSLKRVRLAIFKIFYLIIWVLLLCHLFACIFYTTGEYLQDSQSSWLNRINRCCNQSSNSTTRQKYQVSLFWSVTTMISVGYGDIVPKNQFEVIITIIIMFLSCILFAYSFNLIVEIIQETKERKKYFDHYVSTFNRHMRDRKVSRQLQNKIQAYMRHNWKTYHGKYKLLENEMIQKLAPALRQELIYESMGVMLQRIQTFTKNFSHDLLQELSNCVQEVRYSEIETVYQQDDCNWDDISIYYIMRGSVELYIRSGISRFKMEVLKDQQYFGLYDFVSGINRQLSAQCLKYTCIYKLSRIDFINLLNQFQKDKEQFHQIRYKVLFQRKFKILGLKCSTCESEQHLWYQCNKTHYIVDRQKLIYEQNIKVNNRKLFQRNQQPKFRTLLQNTSIINGAHFMKRQYKDISFNNDTDSDDEEGSVEEQLQILEVSQNATDNSQIINQNEYDIFIDNSNVKQDLNIDLFIKREQVSFSNKNQFIENSQILLDQNIDSNFNKNIEEIQRSQSVEQQKEGDFNKIQSSEIQIGLQQLRESKFKLDDDDNQNNEVIQNFHETQSIREKTQSYNINRVKGSIKLNKQQIKSDQQQFKNRRKYTDLDLEKQIKISKRISEKPRVHSDYVEKFENKIETNPLLIKLKKLQNYINSYEGIDLLSEIYATQFKEDKFILPQVRQLEKYTTSEVPREYQQSTWVNEREQFSIDTMCNYEYFFPHYNPTNVVKLVKKFQKKQSEKQKWSRL